MVIFLSQTRRIFSKRSKS